MILDRPDVSRQALADRKITRPELNGITQAGANARESLKAGGGSALKEKAGQVDSITERLARGDLRRAGEELQGFERQLGDRNQMGRPAPDRAQPERPQQDSRDAPNLGGGGGSRRR